MAAQIAKYAINKELGRWQKDAKKKDVCGSYDPYFSLIDDPRHPGRKKKVKKLVPSYIPEHDAKVLAKMRKRAYRMDMALGEFFGIRFGVSSIIGIVPAAGDTIDALIAISLVLACRKVEGGLPPAIQLQMLINVLIDFVLGLVPFLGDLADAWFKANTMNVRVLENYLDSKYKPAELRTKQNRHDPPATAYEDFSDDEDDRRAFINETNGGRYNRRPAEPVAQKKKSGGWFSGGGGGSRRERDLERGQAPPTRPPRPSDQETGTVYGGR